MLVGPRFIASCSVFRTCGSVNNARDPGKNAKCLPHLLPKCTRSVRFLVQWILLENNLSKVLPFLFKRNKTSLIGNVIGS